MTNLSITKTYNIDLPREQLYEAWISPETVIAPVSKIEVDPKVGGYLRLIAETPEGNSVMHGEFLVLAHPDQLVYTWEWDQNGEVTQITVDFRERAGGTEIMLNHTGFESEESRAMHDAGWDSYVDGVVQKLEGL